MPRLNLSGGTYQARSLAVSAQRCLNLFPEPLPQVQGEPIQFAHYPTPGLKGVCNLGPGVLRCLYTTSQGDLIAVAGSLVYLVDRFGKPSRIGEISGGTGQVRMQDNGLTLFIVDGTPGNGWYCSIPGSAGGSYGAISKIADSAFYGSATVAVLDTFLLFVNPNTTNWYVSPANFVDESTTPFDSLYVASKTSYPDIISGIATVGQTIWIFGRQTTELWYDSGAADFPFQRIPSITADQGCESPWSIATNYGQIFWLGRDRSGHARVYMGQENATQAISTFAIEYALNQYAELGNAIGNTYQQDGHQFYVLTLPDQGKTWVYDATVGLWHERCGLNGAGQEARIRANCWASAYGRVFCGDYENGWLYEVRTDALDDAGTPIKRQRGFPHLVTDGKRGIHRCFMLDMQCGSNVPVVVDWSDDRGATWSGTQTLSLGNAGGTWPTIWRLGIARDRIYRVTWTGAAQTALMGAFIEFAPVAL